MLKQAKTALDRLSADDIARLQAEHREMALLTFEAGIAAAREEAKKEGLSEGLEKGLSEGLEKGLSEGLEKGLQKGTAQVLLRLLILKFGPQSASTMERLSGASHADLLRWSERVLSAETLEGVIA